MSSTAQHDIIPFEFLVGNWGCCHGLRGRVLHSDVIQSCLLISRCWRSPFDVASESTTCDCKPRFLLWEGMKMVGSPLKWIPWVGWPASCELGGWGHLKGLQSLHLWR